MFSLALKKTPAVPAPACSQWLEEQRGTVEGECNTGHGKEEKSGEKLYELIYQLLLSLQEPSTLRVLPVLDTVALTENILVS